MKFYSNAEIDDIITALEFAVYALKAKRNTNNAGVWQEIVDAAEPQLPVGLIPILTDPSKTRCEIDCDTLRLYVEPGFFYNAINNQDILTRIREATCRVLGKNMSVQLSKLENGNGSSESPQPNDMRRIADLLADFYIDAHSAYDCLLDAVERIDDKVSKL